MSVRKLKVGDLVETIGVGYRYRSMMQSLSDVPGIIIAISSIVYNETAQHWYQRSSKRANRDDIISIEYTCLFDSEVVVMFKDEIARIKKPRSVQDRDPKSIM